jgi:diguanylate cyclase (GGDEF)-like protein
LIEVASTLRRTLRTRALCARLGGEEFCALLSLVASDEELFALGERVHNAVGALRFNGFADLRPTVSVGLARRQPHEPSVRDTVTRADQALYAAKRDGRNRTYLERDATLRLAS